MASGNSYQTTTDWYGTTDPIIVPPDIGGFLHVGVVAVNTHRFEMELTMGTMVDDTQRWRSINKVSWKENWRKVSS